MFKQVLMKLYMQVHNTPVIIVHLLLLLADLVSNLTSPKIIFKQLLIKEKCVKQQKLQDKNSKFLYAVGYLEY